MVQYRLDTAIDFRFVHTVLGFEIDKINHRYDPFRLGESLNVVGAGLPAMLFAPSLGLTPSELARNFAPGEIVAAECHSSIS
jgi:hypothetical protein